MDSYDTCVDTVKATGAFCSHLARTASMKYAFCEYNEQLCMDSQALLLPTFGGKKRSGTNPLYFYSGASCHWKVGAPSEWNENTVIKIRITRVQNATCFINSGGTLLSANKEEECKEGSVYSFKYTDYNPDQLVFLVTYAQ